VAVHPGHGEGPSGFGAGNRGWGSASVAFGSRVPVCRDRHCAVFGNIKGRWMGVTKPDISDSTHFCSLQACGTQLPNLSDLGSYLDSLSYITPPRLFRPTEMSSPPMKPKRHSPSPASPPSASIASSSRMAVALRSGQRPSRRFSSRASRSTGTPPTQPTPNHAAGADGGTSFSSIISTSTASSVPRSRSQAIFRFCGICGRASQVCTLPCFI
jgi:hypothetical protein